MYMWFKERNMCFLFEFYFIFSCYCVFLKNMNIVELVVYIIWLCKRVICSKYFFKFYFFNSIIDFGLDIYICGVNMWVVIFGILV